MKRILSALVLGTSLFSCSDVKQATRTVTDALSTPAAQAVLYSTSDNTKQIGTVNFYQEKDGQVRAEVKINMLARADSNVAVHIHQDANCGDMGNMAHGHWNPTNENHGRWGQGQYHSGDLGNIRLNNLGYGTLSITTNRWSFSNATNNPLGHSIIVHGGTDDYTTQPTGNSGPRIGCGVITKGQ